jgi:hypothetical protein
MQTVSPWAAVFHHPHHKKVNNCTKEGPNKMMLLWKCLDPLVKGQPQTTGLNGKNQWQIFDGKTINMPQQPLLWQGNDGICGRTWLGNYWYSPAGLFSKGSSDKIFSQGMDKFGSCVQRHHGFCSPSLQLRRSAVEMALQHK